MDTLNTLQMKTRHYDAPVAEVIPIDISVDLLVGGSETIQTDVPNADREDYGEPIEWNW